MTLRIISISDTPIFVYQLLQGVGGRGSELPSAIVFVRLKYRLSGVLKHPPDAMEEKFPSLRVVSAEIETPGQSPRGAIASPSSVMQSGDSIGKAFMHQAMRLKNVVMNQKVGFTMIFKLEHAVRVAYLTPRKGNLEHQAIQRDAGELHGCGEASKAGKGCQSRAGWRGKLRICWHPGCLVC
jgi:hypothetical protein